jgi:RNA polymerase sigma-70 factor (ECF subfamily)
MPQDRAGELFRLYGPVIYVRCRRMLRDAAAAEDATQETFVRVYRHLDEAPNRDVALAWIHRIATNLCLNEIRNRKIRPQPRDALPETHSAANIEGALADRDFASRLIERVPEKVRVVAWLHYVDGMDQEEVARVMGITRRTVFNRIEAFRESADKLCGRGTP